jgi:hypothetical protein
MGTVLYAFIFCPQNMERVTLTHNKNKNHNHNTLSKSFIKYLKIVPEKRDIKQLQKPAILGTIIIIFS